MKVNFIGTVEEIFEGANVLSKRFGLDIANGGLEITVTKREGDLEVGFDGEKAYINYDKKIHFFRGLGLLAPKIKAGEKFSKTEKPCFEKNGAMIDASRNAVMTVDGIKDYIEMSAVMGLNLLMMYTEDTFEVPEYKYFGYQRGRYTEEELSECDRYADMFGIEMIPCIQTLAHFERYIQWKEGSDFSDNHYILMVDDDETYKFLECVLKAATKPFKTNKIHIGMDEAWELGRGKYLDKNGYVPTSEILKRHMAKLMPIIDKLGLEPLAWSDSYFRAVTDSHRGYELDAIFTDEYIDTIPENMGMVYWDYYKEDKDWYDGIFKKHFELKRDVWFAGGSWVWGGMVPNYAKTYRTTTLALASARENGVKNVFATMWGDDGQMTNIYCGLLGIQLFAEMGYGNDADQDYINERFFECTGGDANLFKMLDDFDELKETDIPLNSPGNASAWLLFQDAMLGLLDEEIERDDLDTHFANLKKVYKNAMGKGIKFNEIYAYAYNLANVLEIKALLGKKIKKAYDEGDKNTLSHIAKKLIPELVKRVKSLNKAHKTLWMTNSKMQGYEVIDGRYGWLTNRLESGAERLMDYVKGNVNELEEVAEIRLPFAHRKAKSQGLASRVISVARYVSAGQVFFNN